ncbi:MAG: metallophosphoesterase [Candidatus Hydrogenedentes bacterium]|nr:metallophosphoesterase [Candidatus Hydrogenedentota bacterium]
MNHAPEADPSQPPPQSAGRRWNSPAFTASALAGLAWAGLCYAVETLAFPLTIHEPLQYLYRPLSLLLLPLRLLFYNLLVETGSAPVRFLAAGVAASALMPLLLWGLYALWPARRARRPLQIHDVEPGRRQFLAWGVTLAAGGGMTGIGGHGVLIAPGRIRLAPYELHIADLPKSFDGLRIAHISDTHYGPFITLEYLTHAINLVNGADPDLVVLTGDYIHRTPHAIADGIGVLRRLKAPLGVVGVLGNHDHWEGPEACKRRFAEMGIPLVDNTRLFLTAKGLADTPGKECLCVAGVGDLWTDRVRPKDALAGVPAAMPRLLLSHNPDVAETRLYPDDRVDLMLSGHTHGGQVALPGWGPLLLPSAFGQKYAGGLVEGPHCRVLISRGVGMAALPIRIGVPPEVPIITLRA